MLNNNRVGITLKIRLIKYEDMLFSRSGIYYILSNGINDGFFPTPELSKGKPVSKGKPPPRLTGGGFLVPAGTDRQ
jgi:hypothetical protein